MPSVSGSAGEARNLCYNKSVIITLTGENTFAIARAKRQLVTAFTAKYGANAIEQVDAEDLTAAHLPDLLQGATLFAPSRLVIIGNLSGNKPLLEPLAEALAHMAPDNTVVIADASLDKRLKLYKFLKSQPDFKEFALPSDAELTTWLRNEATQLGGQLGQPEARHLLGRAGRDQWRLANEIAKLVDFQPQVSIAAIDQLVEATSEGSVFELLDAALASKTTDVTRLIAALRTQEDPFKLFGLIASQVHAVAVVAAAGTRSPEVIAKDAGLHPYVVRKTQSLARRLSLARVAAIARDVARCDMQIKSTSADTWNLLQLCLLKIASR